VSALFARVADLPLVIEEYALDRLERDVSSAFTRVSTIVRLFGAGLEGAGEDVVYDAPDHDILQEAGPVLPLAGSWTLGSFVDHLATLDPFPQPPVREVSRRYRAWTFESAALDLALRQAGRPLHEVLGREPRPVRFVVSLRLGGPDEPSSVAPLRRRLDRYPDLEFKLDPTNDWDDALVADVAATGAVESVDFKGHYSGTIVDVEPDPALYARVLRAFPSAWIEDPHSGVPAIDALLEPHRDRVSWDAPIHAVADIEALPWPPTMVNVKPSRMGGLRELFAAYEHCEARGIRMYGGGQFELGPGRGHIQYLASLFHPDGPNDVAPAEFNLVDPPEGLPHSPLAPAPGATGFRWG
jgi:L-alanine-DL-glutamate epimerase-like enolase superfamily enzyme